MNVPSFQPTRHEDICLELARSRLFDGIDNEKIDQLARATTLTHLRKNQPLWQFGRHPQHLYVVICGLVKRTSLSHNGSERVLDLLAGGDCAGLSELIARRPYGTMACAVEATHLLAVDADAVRRLVASVPMLGQRIGELLALRQLHMEDETSAVHSQSSSERVLDFLLQCAPQPLAATGETAIRLPAKKQLVASRIGITPETLSRALRELADNGLIINRLATIYLQNAPLRLRQRAPTIAATFPGRGAIGLSIAANEPRAMVPMNSIINIAGRQRMLSQRMAKYWLMMGSKFSAASASRRLAQSIELFDQQQTLLGDVKAGDAIDNARCLVGELWKPYRTALGKPHSPEAAERVFALNESLLTAADRQTSAFAQWGDMDSSRLVNLAGRQRMLVQRVAKFGLFIHQGIRIQESRENLQEASQEFGDSLESLITLAPSKEIRTMLAKVRQRWLTLQPKGELTAGNSSANHVASVCALSEELVKQMDSAVLLFERAAEAA